MTKGQHEAQRTARASVTAYIALGANLGDAAATLYRAMDDLQAKVPGTHVTRRSSLYRSAPMDANGPDFHNAVVEVRTTLEAPTLLRHLQALEQAAGRERPYRNAPRTLDLDLLSYGEAAIDSLGLTVPHPRMLSRAFVLLPLAEIAPGLVASEDLRRVADQLCEKLGPAPSF